MEWISVEERLPETQRRVLVFFKNEYDRSRITCANYIAPKTVLAEDFLDSEYSDGFEEYDEEKDCYWTPEGFYESNYETDVNYFLGYKVTHWMPLPQHPQSNETQI
jgi:hypothetical protein